MAEFDMLKWAPCDSCNDVETRTAGQKKLGMLLTTDANTWGYFQTPEGWTLNVGYANIGLTPQALHTGQAAIVGINERLVGYNLLDGALCFSYRMPLVFHEFVDVGDSLIVRDEIGFVSIARDGTELWTYYTEGVIESYTVTSSNISGKTMEGASFEFKLPPETA